MKKIRKGLSMAFLAVLFILWKGEPAGAATDFSSAAPISVNQSVSGNVTNGWGSQTNCYTFTTARDGVVQLAFASPLQNSTSSYWQIRLYNGEYREIFSKEIYGNQTMAKSVATGLPAGTYYITVSSVDRYSVASTDIYSLTAVYEESDVWEKEFNDSFLDATPVKTNTEYYGTTRNGFDFEEDYYRFQLEKDGVVQPVFQNPLQGTQNTYWGFSLYNAAYSKIYSSNIYGNYTSTEMPKIGLPAGTYYVKINSPDRYAPKTFDIYSFRINYEAADNWETEFNDGFQTADPLEIGAIRYGTTTDGYSGEKDYFTFTVSETGVYRCQMETPHLGSSGSYWEMTLFDSAYKQITSIYIYGNQTIHTLDRALEPGTYYIQIASADRYSAKSMTSWGLGVNELKLMGDADQDGQLTSDDALAVLMYIAGKKPEVCHMTAADCDGSAGLTSDDALAILMHIAGKKAIDPLYYQ